MTFACHLSAQSSWLICSLEKNIWMLPSLDQWMEILFIFRVLCAHTACNLYVTYIAHHRRGQIPFPVLLVFRGTMYDMKERKKERNFNHHLIFFRCLNIPNKHFLVSWLNKQSNIKGQRNVTPFQFVYKWLTLLFFQLRVFFPFTHGKKYMYWKKYIAEFVLVPRNYWKYKILGF